MDVNVEVVETLRDVEQLGARLIGTAAEREHERERRMPRGKVGHPREDVERGLDEVGGVAALPREDHELRPVDDGGVGMVGGRRRARTTRAASFSASSNSPSISANVDWSHSTK